MQDPPDGLTTLEAAVLRRGCSPITVGDDGLQTHPRLGFCQSIWGLQAMRPLCTTPPGWSTGGGEERGRAPGLVARRGSRRAKLGGGRGGVEQTVGVETRRALYGIAQIE